MNIEKIWNNWEAAPLFSGVFSVGNEKGAIFERCCGFRNRSEKLMNNRDTAFGIASGTKLFTGLAACKLIDAGRLSLQGKLWDLLPYDLGKVDKRVTVHHLLTHTSGVGDYIDEEAPDTLEEMQALYSRYPVYLWERLEYYLPMITPLRQKFEPGVRFGYSNAGFVLLGLVIEAVTGKTYQQYVTDEIISFLKLQHTGFYRMDALPANTACGYIDDQSGQWRTNIFCMPVLGGSDGGLYSCAADLDKLWRTVFAGRVLSENTLQAFLKPQIKRDEGRSYGLGVYRFENHGSTVYYAVGCDYGVDFFTAYFPEQKITASAMGNSAVSTYPLLKAMLSDS